MIETLGHMSGHISIYIEPMKTLISGEMLISEGGVLGIADEQFVLEKEAEINLLKKLLIWILKKLYALMVESIEVII